MSRGSTADIAAEINHRCNPKKGDKKKKKGNKTISVSSVYSPFNHPEHCSGNFSGSGSCRSTPDKDSLGRSCGDAGYASSGTGASCEGSSSRESSDCACSEGFCNHPEGNKTLMHLN